MHGMRRIARLGIADCGFFPVADRSRFAWFRVPKEALANRKRTTGEEIRNPQSAISLQPGRPNEHDGL